MILEWEKKDMAVGPPCGHRIGKEELARRFDAIGISVSKAVNFGDIHYGLVGVKKDL